MSRGRKRLFAVFLILASLSLLAIACKKPSSPSKPASTQEKPAKPAVQPTEKEDIVDEDEPCPGTRRKTNEARFADYVVATYRYPNALGCFEILRRGQQIYTENGLAFYIGGVRDPSDSDSPRLLTPIGTDVTGLGTPDVIVGEWTGGAHCCFIFRIFELGPQTLRRVTTIDAQDSDGAHFEDVDHDGRLEFLTSDWTFAYWGTSFADSPAPDLILRFRDGGFHPALDLMRKPVLPMIDLQSRAITLQKEWDENEPGLPPSLWKEMLDLIYSGNAKQAWQFFDMAWPKDKKGKEQFRLDFKDQLAKSPFWKDLQELNRGQL